MRSTFNEHEVQVDEDLYRRPRDVLFEKNHRRNRGFPFAIFNGGRRGLSVFEEDVS